MGIYKDEEGKVKRKSGKQEEGDNFLLSFTFPSRTLPFILSLNPG